MFAAFGPEVPNECFDWLSIEGPALYLVLGLPLIGLSLINDRTEYISRDHESVYAVGVQLNNFPGDFFAVRVCTGASVPVTLEEYDFHR